MTVPVSLPAILDSADVGADEALSILQEALTGADDGELFLERSELESLVFDDGRLKSAAYDASEGFGLRAVKGEVAGYAHSTEISEKALRRASETARLAVGDGGGVLAAAPKGTNARLYSDADPMADASFAAKIDVLKEIDAYARGMDRRVVQVSATISAKPTGALRPVPTAVPPWASSISAGSVISMRLMPLATCWA